MKRKLLLLCFILSGTSFVRAVPPNSAISTASSRNYTAINYHDSTIVIDGNANDPVWSSMTAISIDRPFLYETPTLYSATWKGFWNDTAVYVLVEVSDDNFWPSWKSGMLDWNSDKVELYFDVNGTIPDGGAACCTQGHYQVTHNYSETNPGTVNIGYMGGIGYESDTWSYDDPAALTTEWCVPFAQLVNSNYNTFDPWITSLIGFDVYAVDLDSAVAVNNRQRQVWSNIGISDEDWNDMDSAGMLQFAGGGVTPPPSNPPNSATSTDTERNHASIYFKEGAIVLDGQANESIWAQCDPIFIDRPFQTEVPTLYWACWKAFYNDTAIFILVQYQDDNFWPVWKSGVASYLSDKVELYFNANGDDPITNALGGQNRGYNGVYQVTHDYDNVPERGLPQAATLDGSVVLDGTFEANTWSYGADPVLTTEYSIAFDALKTIVNTGVALDPAVTTKITFDITISDNDSSGISAGTRNRQVWSNVGLVGEDWNTMVDAGILEFAGVVIKKDTVIKRIPDGCSITIDGKVDKIWKKVEPHSINRPFTGESPSIAGATWKAMWNDTAIFVLLQVDDDIFMPEYKSDEICEFFERLALYFDVNTTLNDGNGPLSSGDLKKGHYEIAPRFVEDGNYLTRGSNGMYYAQYVNETSANYVFEYSINFSALKDATGTSFNPDNQNIIGFDIEAWDVDVPCYRDRLVWSNSGSTSENGLNMDGAGTLTLSSNPVSSTCVTGISTQKAKNLQREILYPNPVKETLFSAVDIDRVTIYSALGQLVKQISVGSNSIDVSALPQGVYFMNSYKNNEQVGSQMIIKQ